MRVLRLFGSTASRVFATAGPEQEYFLIDKNFYFNRPDLLNAGRTLFGAKPPKGQELEDHYFGAIPERVLACMLETETELYKLGVPVKTRHNEVSPAQYEIAPIFENANVATDHNMLVMETMKRVADRYGLQLLLHEKPFAGVNGSGKHVNWSMADDHGNNLLKPGDTPHDNAQFLIFLVAVIKAVAKHADLLARGRRARRQRPSPGRQRGPAGHHLDLPGRHAPGHRRADRGGRRQVGQGGRRAEDRRLRAARPCPATRATATGPAPSPSRATSSSSAPWVPAQSIAGPIVVLNTIVAEALDEFATELEKAVAAKKDLNAEIQKLLQAAIKESKSVLFNGDNYSEAWHTEAEHRGLPNRRTTIDSLPDLVSPKSVQLFAKYGVLSERELHSRYEIFLEGYRKTINIESQLTIQIAQRMILPAALRYQSRGGRRPSANLKATGATVPKSQTAHLNELVGAIEVSAGATDRLERGRRRASQGRLAGPRQVCPRRDHPRDERRPGRRRSARDLVPDDLWPLPTYQEMLFIK